MIERARPLTFREREMLCNISYKFEEKKEKNMPYNNVSLNKN